MQARNLVTPLLSTVNSFSSQVRYRPLVATALCHENHELDRVHEEHRLAGFPVMVKVGFPTLVLFDVTRGCSYLWREHLNSPKRIFPSLIGEHVSWSKFTPVVQF